MDTGLYLDGFWFISEWVLVQQHKWVMLLGRKCSQLDFSSHRFYYECIEQWAAFSNHCSICKLEILVHLKGDFDEIDTKEISPYTELRKPKLSLNFCQSLS